MTCQTHHLEIFHQPSEASRVLRITVTELAQGREKGEQKGPPHLPATVDGRILYAATDLRLWARNKRNFITPYGIRQCRPTMTDPVIAPDMVTEAEAAAILRLKPDTLRQWRNRRKKGHKKGPPYFQPHAHGRVLYARTDLDAWIKKHRVDPA